MRDGTASHTARSVAAHRLEYERVAAGYGDPAADQSLTIDVADGREPSRGRMHEYLRARTAFFDRAVVNSLDRGVRHTVPASVPKTFARSASPASPPSRRLGWRLKVWECPVPGYSSGKEVPNMRLGKEQSAGYVEDTGVDSIAVEEIKTDSIERTPLTPTPQPSIPVG